MAKRKFLICFPYEGDVKKIDKIADVLENEGIDFMQVDGETPSGEFVSVAKGDIDEVKEDIAEIPGFEGTMSMLDDLTIMPKDEDDAMELDDNFELIEDEIEDEILQDNKMAEFNSYLSLDLFEKLVLYLEDLPEIDDAYYENMSGSFYFSFKGYEDLRIYATPGWEKYNLDNASVVDADIDAEGYEGQPLYELIPKGLLPFALPKNFKDYKDRGYIQEIYFSFDMGKEGVYEPKKGIYPSDKDFCKLYIEKVVYPLYSKFSDDKSKFRAGGGIGYEEVNKGKKSTKKSKQDNSALLGGLAGLVLGIFLNR